MTIVGDVTTWNINLTTLKSSFSIIIIIRPVNLHMKQESTSTAPRLTRQVFFPDFNEEDETTKGEEKEEVPIVAVRENPDGKACPVCREEFEEFYSEDINPERDDGGLWYFRNAIMSDGSNYHPQCLQVSMLLNIIFLCHRLSGQVSCSWAVANIFSFA
jgi:hypothetical protein